MSICAAKRPTHSASNTIQSSSLWNLKPDRARSSAPGQRGRSGLFWGISLYPPRVRGEGRVGGLSAALEIGDVSTAFIHAQNCGEAPSPSFASLSRPLPAQRGEVEEREQAMPRHLKRGIDASAIKAADAKVREMVEQILADIDARKDAAVRELSQKFDNWSPASFKLTPPRSSARSGRCESAISTIIKFAQAQVRNFAQKQKDDDCATSKSRRCPASCSATGTSRSTRSAAMCPAAAIRWSPPRTCRSSPRRSPA